MKSSSCGEGGGEREGGRAGRVSERWTVQDSGFLPDLFVHLKPKRRGSVCFLSPGMHDVFLGYISTTGAKRVRHRFVVVSHRFQSPPSRVPSCSGDSVLAAFSTTEIIPVNLTPLWHTVTKCWRSACWTSWQWKSLVFTNYRFYSVGWEKVNFCFVISASIFIQWKFSFCFSWKLKELWNLWPVVQQLMQF